LNNYLLDTCVVSDFFKKIPSVINHFQKVSPSQIHISTITYMEIEYGLSLEKTRDRKIRPLWKELIKSIQVLPFSNLCAIKAAEIRANLKSLGEPIGPYDILIGGSALAHNMMMVTSNMREFKRIKGIFIEDWRTERL
jgi:tRNA(fMet)-specific endonuclease VapC